MCTSLIIWYVVDGKTGGIIPVLWFFIFIEMYFFLKYPRFLVIALLSMVTQVLIIGYELEVRKLGIPVSLVETFLHLCVDENASLQRVADNCTIRSIYWRHTDWHVFQAACWLPSSGHSSHTLLRLDHSSEKILGYHSTCLRISILAYTRLWGCASGTSRVTWNPRPVRGERWKRLGTRCLLKSFRCWLACGNTLRSPHGSPPSAANFLKSSMIP